MSRKVVWIEQLGFGGFGCSECGWRFEPSNPPTSKSFEEMKLSLGLQLDKEFTSHVCADHPKKVS
jgi:rubredoxin